jgi:hypothetical protein
MPSSKTGKMTGMTIARSLAYRPYKAARKKHLMETYSIRAEIAKGAPQETLDVIVRDVEIYAEGQIPKKNPGNHVKKVGKIIPNTEPKISGELSISTWGKQDYVPSCLIDINVDLFRKSCSSFLVDGFYDPFAACKYCYAKGEKSDMPLKRIIRADKQNLVQQIEAARKEREAKEKQTRFIRFGKVSEAGSDLTREQLVAVLEASIEAEVSPIFPTKFLKYDKNIAELLRRANTSLIFSIGNDSLERGAVANGCTNEFRFRQAVKCHENGVRVGLYVLIEATNYDNPFFKKNLQKALRIHEKHGIPIQLLPGRWLSKKQVVEITGRPLADCILQGQRNLHDKTVSKGGYKRSRNNQYIATMIDEKFLELLREPGITMCHHHDATTWCGGCLHKSPDKPTCYPTEHVERKVIKRPRRRQKFNELEFLFDNRGKNKMPSKKMTREEKAKFKAKFNIHLHKDKAVEVSKTAVDLLHKNQFPFNQPGAIPDAILPDGVKEGSIEHALFLFYAVGFDAMRKASDVYASTRKMVEDYDVHEILLMGRESSEGLVREYIEDRSASGNSYDDPEKNFYAKNQLLLKAFEGNPLNIAKDTGDVKKIIKNCRRFPTFAEGKSALLLKNYVRFGMITLDNLYELPIKIDRHVVRISINKKVLTVEPEGKCRSNRMISRLRKLYQQVAVEHEISPVELDDAIWVIGSQMCVKKKLAYCQTNCPLDCEKMIWADRRGYYLDTLVDVRDRQLSVFG